MRCEDWYGDLFSRRPRSVVDRQEREGAKGGKSSGRANASRRRVAFQFNPIGASPDSALNEMWLNSAFIRTVYAIFQTYRALGLFRTVQTEFPQEIPLPWKLRRCWRKEDHCKPIKHRPLVARGSFAGALTRPTCSTCSTVIPCPRTHARLKETRFEKYPDGFFTRSKRPGEG